MAGEESRTKRVPSVLLSESRYGIEQTFIEIHRGATLIIEPARVAPKNRDEVPSLVDRICDRTCDCLERATKRDAKVAPVRTTEDGKKTDE